MTASQSTAAPQASKPPKHQVRRGHPAPLPISDVLGGLKRLRVGHLINLLAISYATLYARLHTGSLPRPDGYDGKRPFWRTSTVRAFLES